MRGNSRVWLLAAVCLAMAVEAGALPRRFDSRSDKIMGQMDVFSQTTERRRVCSYKDSTYEEGSIVVTEEPCLKCKCLRGSLVCYLRVCPVLPDPPPPQCVLLLRKGACCSELICEDRGVQTNHISRADISAEEFPTNGTYGDGCIANGTLYASGSAMWTDRPCEYCYCIAGKERCVRPRCLPSPDGCTPRRVPHSCCPVRYDCKHELHHLSTTTTIAAMSPGSKMKGCEVEGVFYPEGEKVTSLIKSRCDNCFCMRGLIRCVPLSCAPPLLGCTPIILPGECCASSYNCSKRIADMANGNELPFISENGQEQDTIVNERSFPDDTPLTPSQIAEILLNGDGRIIRKIENKNSTSLKNNNTTKIDLKKSNSTIETIKLNISTTTVEPLETTTLSFTESDEIFTTDDMDFTTWTESVNSENESTFKDSNPIENTTSDMIREENTTIINKISNSDENKSEKENVSDKSKTFINDTVNCNTELSMLNITESETVDNNSNITVGYNDTEERILYTSINNLSDTDAEETNWDIGSSKNKSNIETSTHADINPKFPSTSLIIPKDDDIFMVNVSTYVRTNTSVVTLRPVAAIPPEIEALLNISLKKNSQKDDYYDYDYKSSLPPSLPNLEIIPFLAIDAVVKSDEIDHDKSKEIDHYATAYPEEEKSYLGSFSTIPREKYNATIYPYINENYNPTTFPPYSEEKYLRSPVGHLNNFNRNQVIYKQHIDDKFQATTYKTILNDKFDENQYGIDKFDATVYPSLTLEDSATDNPTFAYNNRNLFSPPSETEGGFLPRDPPLLGSYFNMGYSGSKDVPNPVTDSTLMVTDQTKPNSDDCLSNGRKYKNGELITEANACVICFCYYGDIHCQDPECPPIKPGCRRIVEKGSNSCCGIEICNDTTENNETVKLFEKDIQQPPEVVTISDRIDKPDPFKDVIRTEPAPDLESLIGDMLPHYSTSSTTMRKPQVTKKPTVNLSSTTEQSTVVYKQSTTPLSTTKDEDIRETTELEISTEYIKEKSSTLEPVITTVIDDIGTEEDEEDVFSFDNVLKLLLGDTDTTTKRHTTTTTRRPTSPVTTPKIISTSLRYPNTPVTTRSILTTAANFFKNSYKNSFSKQNRTVINTLQQKNYTKPLKYTTKPPIVYPTIRYTKSKYTTSTPVPPTIQPFKKMPISHFSTEEPKSPISKKPTTTQLDSSLPFGAGLLKLAGCNIYGRMYRVGRIISELSGPCLECMCTEVGVQCTPLTC